MAKRSLDLIEKSLNKAEYESVRIEKISIDDLVPSQYNDYEMNKIKETAEDIKLRGLRHNLVVWKGVRNAETGEIEQNGKYTIESGHRRLECIKYGNANGLFNIQKVDCRIVPAPQDMWLERLHIIQDNREVRQETKESILKDYVALKEILSELKERGNKFGCLRDEIAKQLGISRSQVGRIENVLNNGIDEVKKKFENGEYSLSTANAVSKLPKNEQIKVTKINDKNAFSIAQKLYKEKIENEQKSTEETETKSEEVEKISNVTETAESGVVEGKKEIERKWEKDDFIKCLEYALRVADINAEQSENIMNVIKGLMMKSPEKAVEFAKQ